MIDLTPLDVRKKKGDFSKALRGYDPQEVDGFILMVAERMEALVKENLTLQERADRLKEQVASQESREHAVREALVTAQELRQDMREQARREADLLRREAESEVERILDKARGQLRESREALEEMERSRKRFLRSFRALLERELDSIEVEEGRTPLEDVPLEIDFKVADLRGAVAARKSDSAPGGSARADSGPGGSTPAGSAPERSAPDGSTEGSSRTGESEGAPPEARRSEGQPTEGAPSERREERGEDGEPLWLSTILEEEGEEEGEPDENGWA